MAAYPLDADGLTAVVAPAPACRDTVLAVALLLGRRRDGNAPLPVFRRAPQVDELDDLRTVVLGGGDDPARHNYDPRRRRGTDGLTLVVAEALGNRSAVAVAPWSRPTALAARRGDLAVAADTVADLGVQLPPGHLRHRAVRTAANVLQTLASPIDAWLCHAFGAVTAVAGSTWLHQALTDFGRHVWAEVEADAAAAAAWAAAQPATFLLLTRDEAPAAVDVPVGRPAPAPVVGMVVADGRFRGRTADAARGLETWATTHNVTNLCAVITLDPAGPGTRLARLADHPRVDFRVATLDPAVTAVAEDGSSCLVMGGDDAVHRVLAAAVGVRP